MMMMKLLSLMLCLHCVVIAATDDDENNAPISTYCHQGDYPVGQKPNSDHNVTCSFGEDPSPTKVCLARQKKEKNSDVHYDCSSVDDLPDHCKDERQFRANACGLEKEGDPLSRDQWKKTCCCRGDLCNGDLYTLFVASTTTTTTTPSSPSPSSASSEQQQQVKGKKTKKRRVAVGDWSPEMLALLLGVMAVSTGALTALFLYFGLPRDSDADAPDRQRRPLLPQQ